MRSWSGSLRHCERVSGTRGCITIRRLPGSRPNITAYRQARLEAMYVDKLDGQVDAVFYNQKAGEWRSEQRSLLGAIEEHRAASETYVEQGVKLLELAK